MTNAIEAFYHSASPLPKGGGQCRLGTCIDVASGSGDGVCSDVQPRTWRSDEVLGCLVGQRQSMRGWGESIAVKRPGRRLS